jgi:hypothetical protein
MNVDDEFSLTLQLDIASSEPPPRQLCRWLPVADPTHRATVPLERLSGMVVGAGTASIPPVGEIEQKLRQAAAKLAPTRWYGRKVIGLPIPAVQRHRRARPGARSDGATLGESGVGIISRDAGPRATRNPRSRLGRRRVPLAEVARLVGSGIPDELGALAAVHHLGGHGPRPAAARHRHFASGRR